MQEALNRILYEGRTKSGLSLREAAKKLHTLPFILKRFEYGYYHISKKLLTRAVELYNLDEIEVANATQSYAGIITKPKKPTAFARLVDKKAAKITILCISAVVFLALIFCAVGQSLTLHNASPFFSEDYKAFSQYMLENDGHVEHIDEESGGVFTVNWNEEFAFGYPIFQYEAVDEEMGYYIVLTSQPLYGFEHGNEITYFYGSEQQEEEENEEFSTSLLDDSQTPEEDFELFRLYLSAVFKSDGTLDYIKSITLNGEDMDDEETRNALIETVVELYEDTSIVFDHFFSTHDETLKTFSYSALIAEISKTCYTIVIIKIVSFLGLIITVAAIYPLAIIDIKMLIGYIRRKRASTEPDNEEVDLLTGESNAFSAQNSEVNTFVAEAAITSTGTKKEKPHIFPLILHERLVRLFGLIALACGSSVLIITVNSLLFKLQTGEPSFISEIIFNYLYLYPLPEKYTLVLDKLLPFFKVCTPIAVVILFFVKIDIMTSRSDIFKTVATFAFIGLYLYFLEFLLLDKIHMLEEFLEEGSMLFSGNMFLGMTAYTLFAAFMLYTPEFAKKSECRRVVWRCLAILPVAYLLIGNIVIPRVKVSAFTAAAFYSSGTMSTLFVLFYVTFIFVLQVVRSKKYAHTPISIRRGKSFYFMKNVAAILALILAVGIDALLAMSEKTATFSSGASWLSLIAIPFMLFYQPRLEPRKSWGTIVFIIFYFLAYTIPFSIGLGVILASPFGGKVISFAGTFVKEMIKYILLT